MLVTSLILALALAADDFCALPGGTDANACSKRVGHCFDMEIDGKHVEPLDDAVGGLPTFHRQKVGVANHRGQPKRLW